MEKPMGNEVQEGVCSTGGEDGGKENQGEQLGVGGGTLDEKVISPPESQVKKGGNEGDFFHYYYYDSFGKSTRRRKTAVKGKVKCLRLDSDLLSGGGNVAGEVNFSKEGVLGESSHQLNYSATKENQVIIEEGARGKIGGGIVSGELHPPMVSKAEKEVEVQDNGRSADVDSPPPPVSTCGGVVSGEVNSPMVPEAEKEVEVWDNGRSADVDSPPPPVSLDGGIVCGEVNPPTEQSVEVVFHGGGMSGEDVILLPVSQLGGQDKSQAVDEHKQETGSSMQMEPPPQDAVIGGGILSEKVIPRPVAQVDCAKPPLDFRALYPEGKFKKRWDAFWEEYYRVLQSKLDGVPDFFGFYLPTPTGVTAQKMGEWVDSHNFKALRLAPDVHFVSRVLRGPSPRPPPPPPPFVGEGTVSGEVNPPMVFEVENEVAVGDNGRNLDVDAPPPPVSSDGGIVCGEVNPPMVFEVENEVVVVGDSGPNLDVDSPPPPVSSDGGAVSGEVISSQIRKRSKEPRASSSGKTKKRKLQNPGPSTAAAPPRDPKEKGLKCPHCPKILCKKFVLNRHIIAMHTEKAAESPESLAARTCDICARVLSRPDGLIVHMKDKHGIKKLKCTKCPKKYSSAKRLNEHIKKCGRKKRDKEEIDEEEEEDEEQVDEEEVEEEEVEEEEFDEEED